MSGPYLAPMCMAISKASLSWRKWIFLCVCDVLFIVAIIIRHLVQPKQWQIVYVLQATEKKNLISRLKILQRVAPHVVLVVAEVILGLPGSIGKTQVSRQQFNHQTNKYLRAAMKAIKLHIEYID